MDNYNPLPIEKKWEIFFEKQKIFKTQKKINPYKILIILW
jgi:leucyl-tRNA synthetase